MLKRNKKHSEEEGGEAWLLPYSDLMTLLLAVFIVLFAVSKLDQSKAEDLAQAFRDTTMTGAENSGDSIVTPFPDENDDNQNNNDGETDTSQEGTNISHEELEQYLGKTELSNLEELKTEIVEQNEDMSDYMSISIDTRGLVISLKNAAFFESGDVDIKPENEGALLRVAKILNSLDNYIRVEGHTDNIPIHNDTYPSNWELSTARASSVVRLFINEGKVSPEKIVAVGYGEYKPIADNSTPEGRAQNRRIDVIVLSEKYNNLEQHIDN
jgi:chemotaxis protein MotB